MMASTTGELMRKLRSNKPLQQSQAVCEISAATLLPGSPASADLERFVAAGAIPALVRLLGSASAVEVLYQVCATMALLS